MAIVLLGLGCVILALQYCPWPQNNDPPDETTTRRLLAEVDAETLERYKADPSGFRRHPSYYSDKYLPRAPQPVDTYGSWTLVDSRERPGDDFYTKYPNRDVPWAEFPENAWQKDPEYLPQFLDQGIALVERAMEAILTEYGLGKDRDKRDFEERIQLMAAVDNPSVATLAGDSHLGLRRRILHAIVTQDTFTFALSGHSAAAGRTRPSLRSFAQGT